jgi:galactokinase
MRTVPRRLIEAWEEPAGFAFAAPGRANLIGEHTDYNAGLVLPVALEIATYVVGVESEEVVSLTSLDVPGRVVVDLSTGEGPTEGWGRYVTGVVRALLEGSIELRGITGVIASEVPTGSGLSSSAALEVTVASALVREPLDAVRLARICRRAENEYVGVRSGIMDQLASAAGRAGCAILIDCRDETMRPVPLPDHVRVVVVDSGVRRDLASSDYNLRRAECDEASRILDVSSLREADADLLANRRGQLDETIYRRARHVITENARVLETVDALETGDLVRVGSLLDESHRSLREDFDVTPPELDLLAEIARSTGGVYGARLTGAGFGGCTVQLVEATRAHDAAAEIRETYRQETGQNARCWVSRPAEGAGPARLA